MKAPKRLWLLRGSGNPREVAVYSRAELEAELQIRPVEGDEWAGEYVLVPAKKARKGK